MMIRHVEWCPLLWLLSRDPAMSLRLIWRSGTLDKISGAAATWLEDYRGCSGNGYEGDMHHLQNYWLNEERFSWGVKLFIRCQGVSNRYSETNGHYMNWNCLLILKPCPHDRVYCAKSKFFAARLGCFCKLWEKGYHGTSYEMGVRSRELYFDHRRSKRSCALLGTRGLTHRNQSVISVPFQGYQFLRCCWTLGAWS